jgi:anti-sigma factor RsiW
MSISLHNYEAFFLDYVEGNLTPEDVAVLMLFIEENPELQGELEAFESMSLNDGTQEGFDAKESLKKTEDDLVINASNCDDLFIAYHEGDLSAGQQGAVDAFLIKNPELQKQFDEFESVYLEADQASQFAAKPGLQHDEYAAAITAANCEFFFIAFYEGDLNTAKKAELETFLLASPHLNAAFESFANLSLEADLAIAFPVKADLEHDEYAAAISADNYEFFFIAFYEGDLNTVKRTELETFLLASPHLNAAFESFANLSLEADLAVVFSAKADLEQGKKRRGLVVPMWRYIGVAAAAAAMLLFIFRYGMPDALESPSDTIAITVVDTASVQGTNEIEPQIANIVPVDSFASDVNDTPLIAVEDEHQSPIEPTPNQHNVIEQTHVPNQNLAQDGGLNPGQEQQPEKIDTMMVPIETPVLPDQNLIAAVDSNDAGDANPQETLIPQNAIAVNTEPEFQTPKELMKERLLGRIAGEDRSATDNVAVAYGNSQTEEKKFSYSRKSTKEHRSVDIKIGGFSLTQKKRTGAVTNSTP